MKQLKQTGYYLIAAILISLFFCFQSFAEDKLIILRGGEWKPYHYTNPAGNSQGFVIDILEGASRISGIDIEIRLIPSWSRCIHFMKTGKADAFMPLFKTIERESFMDFYNEGILTYEEDSFFSSKDNTISFSGNLKDLSTYLIGTTRGYSYGQEFDKADYLKKIPVDKEQNLLNLLLVKKRYDLILGDKRVIINYATEMGLNDNLRLIQPPLIKAPLYIGFSKVNGNSSRNRKFAEGIIAFKQTEKYQIIMNQQE